MSLFLWEFLDYGIATTLIATEVFNSIILNRRFKENEVHTFSYRQLGCLTFSLIFWAKIKQLFSNFPASYWTFSFKTAYFC